MAYNKNPVVDLDIVFTAKMNFQCVDFALAREIIHDHKHSYHSKIFTWS